MKISLCLKILFIIFLSIILGILYTFYYKNINRFEPFCNNCRIQPDIGSGKNTNNFIISKNNITGETNPPNLSQTVLHNRCSQVPIGVRDSSYIFCPFTNNCSSSIYPGKSYDKGSQNNSSCVIDNSCCNTEFYNSKLLYR